MEKLEELNHRTRCKDCSGRGWAWQLPNGMNAFAMRIEDIQMHSRRVNCFACHGEGTITLRSKLSQEKNNADK